MTIENKIKLIDKIVEKHPAFGVAKGWSKYTGGMFDTGEWDFRKMLDVPFQDLQNFLFQINEAESKTVQEAVSPEDMEIVHFNNGFQATKGTIKRMEEIKNEFSHRILLGS